MDDSVFLATSRINTIRKTEVLYEFCQSHDRKIHSRHAKLFVDGGNEGDKQVFYVKDLVVER